LVLLAVGIKVIDILCSNVLNYFYQNTFVGQDGGDLNKYLQDPNPPELVVMGSSTARFQVNPDSLPVRSCNLAKSMTTEQYHLGILDLMIRNNKIPKYILLSVWPPNYLSQQGGEDKASEDIFFLKYYYPRSNYIRKEINQISRFEKVKFFFQSYRFNGDVTNILKYYVITKKRSDTSYYFYYEPVTAHDSLNTVLAVAKKKELTNTKQNLKLSRIKTEYLTRFIDTCQKYNIKLLCYYFPHYAEDYTIIQEGLDFVVDITKKKNVPFYRFTDENASELLHHPSLWTDGLHLNRNGAIIQTKKLARFVEQNINRP